MTFFSRSPVIDLLLTALAPAIWGTTYIVTSQFLPPDRPFIAALLRVLPAGIALLIWCRRFPLRNEWWKLIVTGILNIGAFQALLFIAAYRLPGGLAAVIGAIQPLLVMMLAMGTHIPQPVIRILAGASTIVLSGTHDLPAQRSTWHDFLPSGTASVSEKHSER